MGRRGRGVEDFFRGFQAGYKTVGGVLQDAELRKIANTTPEEEALKRAANAEEMQRAQAETQALAAQDAETFGAGANADLATGSGMGNQVRTGTQYRMLGKVFDQAPTQEQQDRARLPAMANVLAKYGDPMSAVRLRREAQQGEMEARRMTLEEGRAQRDTQAHEQRMKAGGMELETGQLNLDEAKAKAEQRAAMQKFEASVGAMRAQGVKPGWDDLDRLATEAGMSQQSKADYLSRAYNMDELKTKARAQERAVLIDEAAQKGLDAVVKVYDTHPLFDNGIKGRVVRDKKTGMVSVYDGDALVAQGANDNEVVAMIQQRVRDPIAAVNFEYQMQKVKSGIKKDEADIAQSRASAAASGASAEAHRANARQTGLETKYMEKHGAKMGTTSSAPEGGKPTHIPVKDIMGQTEGVMVFQGGQPTGFYGAADVKAGRNATIGPKVGETRVINGVNAVWDGRGWKAAK